PLTTTDATARALLIGSLPGYSPTHCGRGEPRSVPGRESLEARPLRSTPTGSSSGIVPNYLQKGVLEIALVFFHQFGDPSDGLEFALIQDGHPIANGLHFTQLVR